MKSARSARCISESIKASNGILRNSRHLSSSAIAGRHATARASPLTRAQQPRLAQLASTPRIISSTIRSASTSASDENLSKTPLYDFHIENGGKMVPFAGYAMPVQYSSLSVSDSHNFTRTKASLFDVGHMVQHQFSGPGAEKFLERVTPSDLRGLPIHQSTLSTLLWEETGGIVDDLIITRLWEERFYVVTNAGCREKDIPFLTEQLEKFKAEGGEPVTWRVMDGQGLVALQGPKAQEVFEKIVVDQEEAALDKLYFGQSKYVKVASLSNDRAGPPSFTSSPLLVSRGGYTGEDGFEISIPAQETEAVTQLILEAGGKDTVQLAGLGARDSLRLEAGMCLYGHDLDDTTTPVEAALSWVIGKRRREEGGFNGASRILAQLKPKSKGGQGVERRRIGLVVDKAPAREGATIVVDGQEVGKVTSGCPSPTLKKNIAMGYIKDGLHKAGTEVAVVVRGKERKAVVTKMPFMETKYYKER